MLKKDRVNKYILLFILLSIVLVVSFAGIRGIMQNYYEKNEIDDSYSLFEQEIQAAVKTEKEVEDLLLLVTLNDTVSDYLEAEDLATRMAQRNRVSQLLGSLTKTDSGVCAIVFYDESGTLVGMLGEKFFQVEDKSFLINGDTYSNVLASNEDTYFHVENRVFSKAKGSFYSIGSVALLYNTHKLQEIVDVLSIRQDSFSAVVDKNGDFIVSSGIYKEEYADAIKGNIDGFRDDVVYINTLPNSGWKLVNIIPESSFEVFPIEIRFVNQITYFIVAAVVALMFVVVFRQALKGEREVLELEYEKKRTEMIAYKGQINPHFMYNTLESIRGMALYKEEPEIAKLTGSLSKLFRYNVKGDELVTISEVAKNLREYARIIDYRFMGKIKIIVNVYEEINDILIPKMLIQPILENAVIHGLESKVEGGTAVADFSRNCSNNSICITITDDGSGMNEEQLEVVKNIIHNGRYRQTGIHEAGTKIGIANVCRRIMLFYGDRATISVTSAEGKGTCFSLLLPPDVED